MPLTNEKSTHAVGKLNELLEGELSAVETYTQALQAIKECSCKSELELAKSCHQKRSEVLTQTVRQQGGEPAKSSGVWGAFANAMQVGSDLFGEKAAVAMLEEGEDHGNRQYEDLISDSDPTVQQVARELNTKQIGTHKIMKELKTHLA